MALKLNLGKYSFTLSNQCLESMKHAMNNTVTKERGFILYGARDNILAGKERYGGKMHMSIPENESSQLVGHFHTHPDGWAEPSTTDVESMLYFSDKLRIPFLVCSGANGEVQCTTVKDLGNLHLPKRVTIEQWEKLYGNSVRPFVFVV